MMAQLELITGGARSGKSAFAEQQFTAAEAICYIATGVMLAPDQEMALRIERHQARRSANWQTEERYLNVAPFIQQHHFAGYLLDDVTMLTTNLFYHLVAQQGQVQPAAYDDYIEQMTNPQIKEIEQQILTQWHDIVNAVRTTKQRLLAVTNEVGLGVVPATRQARLLRDIYGDVNQYLAQAADQVYFVISGLPQQIK